jgi:hypothetical protein
MLKTKLIAIVLLLLSLCLSQSNGAAANQSLAEKIVAYCRLHKGEKVGDGECSSLADHALSETGGKGRTKEEPNKGDYVWGEAVYVEAVPTEAKGKRSDIKPGDIIQIRDAKFAGKNGNWTYSKSFGHHTAVVVGVEAGGSTVHILHQNYNGKKVVMEDTLHLGDLKEGWLRFYRPVVKGK